MRNQPAHWHPNTQLGVVAGRSDTVGSGSKMQQPGVPSHYYIRPKQCCTPWTTEVCDPVVSTHTREVGVGVVIVVVVGVGEGVRGWVARHATSIRWARLIAQTFGHGHRAVCGGGHFEAIGVEEHVVANLLVDNCLRANRANTDSAGGGTV